MKIRREIIWEQKERIKNRRKGKQIKWKWLARELIRKETKRKEQVGM
jgi:hypothetical protein